MSETKPETAVVPAQAQQVARPDTRAPIAMTPDGMKLETFEALWRFAVTTVASGFAPAGFAKPEQVVVAVQYGAEIGLRGPMTSLRSIHVIKGQPSLAGQAALALCWQRGVFARVDEISVEGDGDARRATFTARRKGQDHDFSASFSMADAKRAGLLTKDNWKGSPDDMLTWRAVGRWMKRYAPDVLMGMPITEEAIDYPPEPARDVTPASPAPQQSGLGLLAMLDAEPEPEPVSVEAEVVAPAGDEPELEATHPPVIDLMAASKESLERKAEPFDVEGAELALMDDIATRAGAADSAEQDRAQLFLDACAGMAMTSADDFDEAHKRLRQHPIFGDAADSPREPKPEPKQPALFDKAPDAGRKSGQRRH